VVFVSVPVVGIGFAEKRRYIQAHGTKDLLSVLFQPYRSLLPAPVRSMPGWFTGVAVHTDDGNLFVGNQSPAQFTTPCARGDIIGCGWNKFTNTVFWTRNGVYLGAKTEVMTQRVYPLIGMDSSSSTLRINFGQLPFTFTPKIEKDICVYCGGYGPTFGELPWLCVCVCVWLGANVCPDCTELDRSFHCETTKYRAAIMTSPC